MTLTATQYAAGMGISCATVTKRIKNGLPLPGVLSMSKLGTYHQFVVGKNYNSEKNKKMFKKIR